MSTYDLSITPFAAIHEGNIQKNGGRTQRDGSRESAKAIYPWDFSRGFSVETCGLDWFALHKDVKVHMVCKKCVASWGSVSPPPLWNPTVWIYVLTRANY